MATLTIGRVSLSCDPETLQIAAGRRVRISSSFTGSSLDQLKALRDELAATLGSGDPIPVTWDEDGTIDGFYQPAGGKVRLRSLSGYGFVDFDADLVWLGDDNTVRFCSLVTGADLTNDHSFTGGVGYVGPPTGRYGYAPAASSTVLRKGEDGNIRTFLAVASGDNPEWHVSPANFYKNACEITVNGYLRAGVTVENDPTDWLLSNGLVKAAPTTDGALTVSHYDGAAWRATTWAVNYDGSAVGNWGAVQILCNRPERCSIRLIQERSATQGILYLDLSVRRGSRILEGVFYSDIGTASMALDTDTAGTTSGTPTGSMKAASPDGTGHSWMVGSELSTTLTTATGTMAKTAARLPFMITKEIDEGGGVQAGDTDDDLWAQYMGWRSERVRTVTT